MQTARTQLTVLLCIAALLFAACDDAGTGTQGGNGLPYNGTNGFVIDGGGYNRLRVDADSSIGILTTFIGRTTAAIYLFGTYKGQLCQLSIVLDSVQTAGSYSRDEKDTSNSRFVGVLADIEGEQYNSSTSRVVLTRVGAVGERITGTVESTLEGEEEELSIRVYGRFAAIRRD